MTVAFFGHSEYVETYMDKERLLVLLEQKIGDSPVEFFLGEYGGFDRFAYGCAREFKKNHPHAKLVFVSPYPFLLKRQCDIDEKGKRFDLVLYPPLENIPPRYAILRRNRWMIEHSDMVFVYVKHRYGGAYAAYQYAVKTSRELYNLALGGGFA